MQIILSNLVLVILLPVLLYGQDSLVVEHDATHNPLKLYLHEIDEMGRLLSGWEGPQEELQTWFFGSYAMLVLRNNGHSDTQPFPGLEASVPALWSDIKYLTPRYLVELAGGALSYGKLMSVVPDHPFESMLPEEQFIRHVAGLSYLQMLYGTLGDSLFSEILNSTMKHTQNPKTITDKLISSIQKHCGSELSKQFGIALSSGSWMDIELEKVLPNSTFSHLYIKRNGVWSFPVDMLLISKSGDSTWVTYDLDQKSPFRVDVVNLKRVILDPEHKLAEYYRYNNKWPRIKGNLRFQPFVALPDWEYYRFTLNPSSWSDWDGDKRYGLKITTGFGVDLWPAYPSNYRHRITLELNSHKPYDANSSWGGRVVYGSPISFERRLFSTIKFHSYDDWDGMSLGLTKYFGQQRFLIQGPKLKYQRFEAVIENAGYGDTLIWKQKTKTNIFKSSYSTLALTRFGDRLYINLRAATGNSPTSKFSIMKSQIDLSGVFWNWLVGGIQFVGGTQDSTTPAPYKFTHDYAWNDNLSALPNFRGQTKISHQTNNYLGLSVSAGYWLSWSQLKIFASSMVYDQAKIKLNQAKPHNVAGFGIEHKSFFTAGLYFPVWQSHPLAGEKSWAWRYQWRLTWNL